MPNGFSWSHLLETRRYRLTDSFDAECTWSALELPSSTLPWYIPSVCVCLRESLWEELRQQTPAPPSPPPSPPSFRGHSGGFIGYFNFIAYAMAPFVLIALLISYRRRVARRRLQEQMLVGQPQYAGRTGAPISGGYGISMGQYPGGAPPQPHTGSIMMAAGAPPPPPHGIPPLPPRLSRPIPVAAPVPPATFQQQPMTYVTTAGVGSGYNADGTLQYANS